MTIIDQLSIDDDDCKTNMVVVRANVRTAKVKQGETGVYSNPAGPLAVGGCTHAPSSLSRVMNLITRYSRSVCQRGKRRAEKVRGDWIWARRWQTEQNGALLNKDCASQQLLIKPCLSFLWVLSLGPHVRLIQDWKQTSAKAYKKIWGCAKLGLHCKYIWPTENPNWTELQFPECFVGYCCRIIMA